MLNVAAAVAQSQAATRTPGGAGKGVLPPFLDVRWMAIKGEERRWLYMHPPSEASIEVRVPRHAYFQAGLALDPETWATNVGDGVRFILEAEDGAGTRTTLMDRQVNPRARTEERDWVHVWVSLAPLADQRVRLILRTDPAQDLSFDWAGWAEPKIVTWEFGPARPRNTARVVTSTAPGFRGTHQSAARNVRKSRPASRTPSPTARIGGIKLSVRGRRVRGRAGSA